MGPEFARRLHALKQNGAQVLVCGDYPYSVFTPIITNLLGFAPRGRSRILTVYDHDPDQALQYVHAAGPSTGPPQILDPVTTQRSTSTLPATAPSTARLRHPPDTINALLDATTIAVEALATARNQPFQPGDLRYHLDSATSLIDTHGLSATHTFLAEVRACIRDWDGISHFVLPAARETDVVTACETVADATLELRLGDDLEQRWHLPESNTHSGWLPVQ